MRRLLQVAIVGLFVLGFTADERAHAFGNCIGSPTLCERATIPPSPGGPKPVVPPQKEAYCTDSAFPTFHQLLMPVYQTADDKSILGFGLEAGKNGVANLVVVVPDIAVTQFVVQWCSSPTGTSNTQGFWVPLATRDSVALTAGLLAEVRDDLTYPNVVWLDVDKDHGWLWVNIEHHVSITPPAPVEARATAGNEVTGHATAWIRATPVSFTIELPKETGVKGTQLAKCDLTQATSAKGCEIKFTHSSSISKDGWFTGKATITWAVSSNSGKYNGLGPFTTSSEVRVQVAEMMAVSRPVED